VILEKTRLQAEPHPGDVGIGKKYIEAGNLGGKGTDVHNAHVGVMAATC